MAINLQKSYPTPPASAFHHTIKSKYYPYVFMGDLNEKHYNNDILERFSGIIKSGTKTSVLHYKTYDWVSNDYFVELKSRNNEYSSYNTTMIGYNKVEEWKKDNTSRKYFFLFGFLDGLYEWELTQENYDTIGGYDAVKKKTYNKGKSFTTLNQNKEHLYIPINKLKKVNDKGCLIPDVLVCDSIRKQGCFIKFL